MSKSDPQLGKEIHEYLVSKGVESPINFDKYGYYTRKDKVALIQSHMTDILDILGFDLTNDSVADTPKRVAKMWVEEVMSGLDYDNFPRIMTFENSMQSGINGSGMVIERSIKSMSLCSHHLVTIDGKCHVAYIPDAKVIGLSKINRVVEFFSKRPQEAERLALQIYHALSYILDTTDVAVVLSGTHYCVRARGVEDENADTVTSKLGGSFMTNPALRAEFFNIIQKDL